MLFTEYLQRASSSLFFFPCCRHLIETVNTCRSSRTLCYGFYLWPAAAVSAVLSILLPFCWTDESSPSRGWSWLSVIYRQLYTYTRIYYTRQMGERCIIRFSSFIYGHSSRSGWSFCAGWIVSTVLLLYRREREIERLCWPTSFVIFLPSPALVFHQLNSLVCWTSSSPFSPGAIFKNKSILSITLQLYHRESNAARKYVYSIIIIFFSPAIYVNV